ncbi:MULTISPECIES: cytochrome b N-terminal domain-containing protein [Streptomyces]|uniref:Cytochrome bc1 complex cytochrome b subunit n=1 Tax=Streptomyces zinciresistens K42 TaxID=700597 RepID=G2G624_9ACTN|nr:MULTISPECIES: cytochrome b N-terminal domain-containing protein [Streptomyces]EGX61113.1 cytochrome b/b6 domain protein [Streptomyces zinciresistens K42]MDT9696635.1 cytochrome b N-terminal domain-containing protein [Streptomyces sp. P17]
MTSHRPERAAAAGPETATPQSARPGRLRRAVDAIDERMGIKALACPMSEHANNLTWSLGGLTVVSFVTLLVTGIYIAQFYSPTPKDANQSVRDLVTDVWLGCFARGLHYWPAQAMFVLALLHLLRVFFHASFKKPREGNWITGSAMFLLTFLAIFTARSSSGTRKGTRRWSTTWTSPSCSAAPASDSPPSSPTGCRSCCARTPCTRSSAPG